MRPEQKIRESTPEEIIEKIEKVVEIIEDVMWDSDDPGATKQMIDRVKALLEKR